MSKVNCPCYGCPDRAVGCHSDASMCKRGYLEWKAEERKKTVAIQKEKQRQADADGFLCRYHRNEANM